MEAALFENNTEAGSRSRPRPSTWIISLGDIPIKIETLAQVTKINNYMHHF